MGVKTRQALYLIYSQSALADQLSGLSLIAGAAVGLCIKTLLRIGESGVF